MVHLVLSFSRDFFSQRALTLLLFLAFSLCPRWKACSRFVLSCFFSCPRFNVGTESTFQFVPAFSCLSWNKMSTAYSCTRWMFSKICPIATNRRNPAQSPLSWKLLGFFTLIRNYRRYSSEIYTSIAVFFAYTSNNHAQHHDYFKDVTRLCLHFGTPIWRRSSGCQDFSHVSENDL